MNKNDIDNIFIAPKISTLPPHSLQSYAASSSSSHAEKVLKTESPKGTEPVSVPSNYILQKVTASATINDLYKENAQLRHELNKYHWERQSHAEDLERRLGKMEYENEELMKKLSHYEECNKQDKDGVTVKIEDLKRSLKHISMEKRQLISDKEELQKKLTSLESYLGELPTVEECKKRDVQLKQARRKVIELQHEVTTLKQQRDDADYRKSEIETKLFSAESDIQVLESHIRSLAEKPSILSSSSSPQKRPVTKDLLEDMRFEMEQLRQSSQHNEEILVLQKKQMAQSESKFVTTLTELKRELSETQELLTGTQKLLRGKENEVQQLKATLHQFTMEKQTLYSELLDLRTTARNAANIITSDCNSPSGNWCSFLHRLFQEQSNLLIEFQRTVSLLLKLHRKEKVDLEDLRLTTTSAIILDDLNDPSSTWIDEENILASIPSIDELVKRLTSVRDFRSTIVKLHHQLCKEHARIIGEGMYQNFTGI